MKKFNFETAADLMFAVTAGGSFYFSPGWMKALKTRVYLVRHQANDGSVFITSDIRPHQWTADGRPCDYRRAYRVHYLVTNGPDALNVKNLGEFHETLAAAKRSAVAWCTQTLHLAS